MPSISDMRVAYESDVAAKAKADADALNSAGNAAETLDKKITSTTKSGAAFVNRFDDVTRTAKAVERAQRDLDAAQDALNKSMANGSVTAEQAQRTLQTLGDRVTQATAKHQAATAAQKTLAEATDSVTTAAERNTASVKLQSYQIAQIADEFHKWVDQVLAGGSAITATTYQLPNMVQAMGGVGNAAKVVGGFLAGPGGIAVAAAAAGVSLYAMASRAETDQEKFAALSTQLRATRTDAMSMASAITSASDSLKGMPGWDEASARTASQAIGGTYDFSGNSSDITALAGVARDAGAVFGSLEDGLKAVQTAMTDPLAEIRDLYQRHLPGVNAQLVDQVRDLEAAGKQGAAYALVMEHLTDAVKNAHEESLTPFQRAMEDLNKAASPLLDTLEKLATGIGTKLLNGVTSLLNLLPHSDAASQSASGTHVVTNPSSGTLGIMQINPAYSSQYDVNSLSGNIDEGITRYQNFLKQSGGNLENALALYGGWKTGSAGGQQYASSVFGQNLADLTPAISKAIDQEAQKFGLGDGLTSLIKKIALQESGGRQWDDQSYATPSAASSAAATAHATSAAVISDQAALSAGAADAANGYSSTSITQSRQAIEDWIGVHEKMLGGLTQGSREWQEESERITNAKIALANTLDPQTSITQGMKDQNESLSAQSGWWRSMAEVVAQFDTTTRGTGVNQQALTQALTEKQRQLTAAYEDGTTEIERQVRAQAAISSAAGDSSRALQHAANYQEAYNAATQNFDPASQKFVEEVNARVSALDALSDAQQRTQQLQQNRGLSDNLALLQAETASIGQDSDARQVGIARLQAEMEMRRQYGAVLPQEAQDYVELSRQVSAASVAYERQQQTLSDLTGSISNMADQLSDGLVQGFLQGTSSGMSFKSTLQAIETQIASMILKMGLINPLLNDIDGGTRDTLSDISKLLGNLGGSSGSSSGDGWGSTGGAMDFEGSGISVGQELNLKNSLSSPASATSATSGSWLQSALGTKVIGNASIGNMLAGLGGGMAVGGLVGSLTGGGSGSTIGSLVGSAGGTGIGALIGTGLSSIGGPLGAVIGGTVLGGIGSLIGSLFSKSHYAYDSVSGQDGQLVISDRRVKRSDDDVSGSLQSALDAINAVYGYTGVSVDDGFVGDVGHYKKGKNSNSQTLEQHLGDAHLTSSDATMQMALDQLMPSSFDSVSSYTQAIQSLKTLSDTLDSMGVVVGRFDDSSHLTVAHFTGYTGDMATALSTLDGQTISLDDLQSKFQAIEEFVGTTMPGLLDVTASGSQSLTQQVDDLQKKYQDAANTAASYGLSAQALLDKGNAIAATMIANETTTLNQNDQAVQARYLAASGDQQGADLLNFDVSAAQQVKQLQDNWDGYLGDTYASNVTYQAQMADLDRTLAAERLQIQEQYAGTSLAQQKEYLSQADQSVAGVFSNLSDYASGLMTSDASPLSVQDQYAAANDNLQSDYQAALGGDYDALSRVQSDMQTYLTEAKAWFGSGTGYADAVKQVSAMLAAIGAVGSDTYTASLAKQLAQQGVDATLAVKQSVDNLNSNVAQLRRLITVGGVKAA